MWISVCIYIVFTLVFSITKEKKKTGKFRSSFYKDYFSPKNVQTRNGTCICWNYIPVFYLWTNWMILSQTQLAYSFDSDILQTLDERTISMEIPYCRAIDINIILLSKICMNQNQMSILTDKLVSYGWLDNVLVEIWPDWECLHLKYILYFNLMKLSI